MIPVSDNEAAANARYEIERAIPAEARWELYAGDVPVGAMDFEFQVEWGKLIFAWWNDTHSQSWRVVAYELDRAEIRLQVTRGMARERAILTLRDDARWRETQDASAFDLDDRRNGYAQLLARLIPAQFAGARLERVTATSDRTRQLAGKYARLVLRRAGEVVLAIGVSEGSPQLEIDAVIAAGLVWLARFNEARKDNQRASALMYFLPRDHAQTAIERLTWIDPAQAGASLECFEVDEKQGALSPVRPVTQQELLNAHPRNVLWPGRLTTGGIWRERILQLAPDLIEARQLPHRDGESYAIHGLEFARVTGAGKQQVTFGVAGWKDSAVLAESSFGMLEQLVQELSKYRSAAAQDRRHPLYRSREEAWLESLLRRNIGALDAGFDPRFIYSQIPAWRGEERSVIDLLTVNHEGRLAVIEIKAAEDAQLPMQGLDYWLRVEQARLRGEFARRGLFVGIELADKPPLLYLVAPRLRFHRTFALIAQCLSEEIRMFQTGINANWREGIKVRTRERINGKGRPKDPESFDTTHGKSAIPESQSTIRGRHTRH